MNPSASAMLEQGLTWLARASCEAAVLALVVFLITRLCGKRLPARWRFALWLVVFVRLALPVAPAAPWSVFRLSASPSQSTPAREDAVALAPLQAPLDKWHGLPSPSLIADGLGRPSYNTDQSKSDAVPVSEPWFSSWTVVLAFLWCAGLVLLAGRWAWLGFRLARRRRSWRPVADPSLQTLFQACRQELALTQRVELLLVVEPATPALVGAWRPRILLPERMAAHFSREELRLILLHELVHVRRRDVLIDRVAALLACLHWFNPAAWLALICLRNERELACDAAVLDHLGGDTAVTYGRVLLKIVEDNQRPRLLPGAVGVFGRTPALTRRIHVIAHYRKSPARQTVLGLALLLLLAAFGLTESRSDLRGQDAEVKDKPVAEAPGKTVKFAGVCRDENDKSLKGVHVVLYRENYRKLTAERLKEVVTDGEGRFALLGLPALPRNDRSTYVLVVTANGRAATNWRGYDPKEAPEDVVVKMPLAATLRGRVTDSAGKPVAGAMVWTDGLLGQPLEGVHSARTDADGRYAITDLQPWDVAKEKPLMDGKGGGIWISGHYFYVRHPQYAERRLLYYRVPDVVDVVLEPAAVIEGRVIDQVSGKPAAGVVVGAGGTNASDIASSHAIRTDEEGKYRLTSLAAGSYNIWADAPARACPAIDTFPVAAGKTVTAPDLKLVEGAWLEGRVVDAESGKPSPKDSASGVNLYVGLYGPSRPKSGAARLYSEVDDQGYFRLLVAPGLQFPSIIVGDAWQRTQRTEFFEKGVEVKAGEVVSVDFRVLAKAPVADPNPVPVRLKMPVPAERDAAATVRRLGGWYEVDKDDHVVEVNLVYHESAPGERQDNHQTDTDEALRVVGAFPRLIKLFLQKGQATDDGLRSVTGLKNLQVLFIWDADKVSDAGVKHLAGLTKLKEVHISPGHLSDESLKVFGRMPSLVRLSLQRNDFTDAGLEQLAKSTQLRALWIGENRTTLTSMGIRHLTELPNLEELDLQGSSVDDGFVMALKNSTNMHSLYLGGSKEAKGATITDASLETVLAMKKLEYLLGVTQPQGVR